MDLQKAIEEIGRQIEPKSRTMNTGGLGVFKQLVSEAMSVHENVHNEKLALYIDGYKNAGNDSDQDYFLRKIKELDNDGT